MNKEKVHTLYYQNYIVVVKETKDCKRFYRDGKLHNDSGPAVIWSDGRQEFWEFDNLIKIIPAS